MPISSNPDSQGTRYFLNSVFEAPCATEEGRPNLSTWIEGADGTNSPTYTFSVCFDNAGPGIVFDPELTLELPENAEFVSATGGGVGSEEEVTWELDALAEGSGDCYEVTVTLGEQGSYGFVAELEYRVGLSEGSVDSEPLATVSYGSVNLLRHGLYDLDDRHAPFNGPIPREPALDPDEDLAVTAFVSGDGFPHDVADLQAGSPILVYYELDGDAGDTLRVAVGGGKIVVTY